MVVKFNLPAIYKSGSLSRSGGLHSAIWKQLRLLDFKPVKAVSVKFDPFHPRVNSIRDFLFYTSASKYRKTNLKCTFKTNIDCNLSHPSLDFELISGAKYIFKTENLSTLEILKEFNKIVLPIALQMEESAPTPVVTKISRKR